MKSPHDAVRGGPFGSERELTSFTSAGHLVASTGSHGRRLGRGQAEASMVGAVSPWAQV